MTAKGVRRKGFYQWLRECSREILRLYIKRADFYTTPVSGSQVLTSGTLYRGIVHRVPYIESSTL